MIKIGTSGFSFPDWRGTIYPKKLPPKDALVYYNDELGFDCVEINSTYYTLVTEKAFEGIEKKTKPDFTFVVKGYRGITHDPFDDRLGGNKPDLKKAQEDLEKFRYSILPLKEKNKLGAVLLQFPVFFYPGESSNDYMLSCKEGLKDIPLVIELRNSSWAKPETFEFLKTNDISYCVVDEPLFVKTTADKPQPSHLMPFINEVTSDIGYIRFHGRNPEWFNTPLEKRYDYYYSDIELKDFLPEIDKLKKKANKSYLFFNNCHAGQAAKNALKLKQLLNIPSSSNKLF